MMSSSSRPLDVIIVCCGEVVVCFAGIVAYYKHVLPSVKVIGIEEAADATGITISYYEKERWLLWTMLVSLLVELLPRLYGRELFM
jgi:threonine dehydratase